ncbi:MAG TPA: hypothetical protein VM681_07895 [Candidatus Thermoplasmatota archaeon]|nr:hypothetical protein [Candidatus Thermoplasmatota archaeon]
MVSGSRRLVVALVLAALAIPGFEPVLVGQVSARDTPTEQAIASNLLPPTIAWQNWTTKTPLHLIRDPNPPSGTSPDTPGDPGFPLLMNSNPLPGGDVPNAAPRPIVMGAEVQQSETVYALLMPVVHHTFTIQTVSFTFHLTSSTSSACQALNAPDRDEQSHDIELFAELVGIFATDADAVATQQDVQLASNSIRKCGAALDPTTQRFATGTIPLRTPTGGPIVVPEGIHLVLRLWVRSLSGLQGQWTLWHGTTAASTRLDVDSRDAVQAASWVTGRDNAQSTTFGVPPPGANTQRIIGYFAVKSAWGGYDNPSASPRDSPFTDRRSVWQASLRAPNATVVHLGQLMPACSGPATPFQPCLAGYQSSGRESIRVFTWPDDRVWEFGPNVAVGEYRLEVAGSMGGASNQGDRPLGDAAGGVAVFRIGGFGVQLAPFRQEGKGESDVGGRIANIMRPGLTRTYLLELRNTGSVPDQIRLQSEVLTPSGANWQVRFTGANVTGDARAILAPGTSTLVQATVLPPPGASAGSSSLIRVTATSEGDAAARAQIELLTTVVADAPIRGFEIFVLDQRLKNVTKGGAVEFNVSVWNHGNDVDSFNLTRRDQDTAHVLANFSTLRLEDVPPGALASLRIRVSAHINATTGERLDVAFRAASQGDAAQFRDCFAQNCASAVVQELRDFELRVMRVGSDLEDALTTITSGILTRVLRQGRDDPNICPNQLNREGQRTDCSGGPNQENLTTDPVDWRYSTVAFYRIGVVNRGDQPERFRARIASASSEIFPEERQAERTRCGSGQGDPFRVNGDETYRLVWFPVYPRASGSDEARTNNITADANGLITVQPGKETFFYLRVWPAWNDHPLHLPSGWQGLCSAVANVRVDVERVEEDTRQPTGVAVLQGPKSVSTQTFSYRRTYSTEATELADRSNRVLVELGEQVLIDGHSRRANFTADVPQFCPPVSATSRLFCKYKSPGQFSDWQIHATGFTHAAGPFELRVIPEGETLAQLRAKGWDFTLADAYHNFLTSPPTLFEHGQPVNNSRAFRCSNGTELRCGTGDPVNTTGAAFVVNLRVHVPANATIDDYARLRIEATIAGRGSSQTIHTVAAQEFRVGTSVITPTIQGPAHILDVHPGALVAFPLNVSNEGSSTDTYLLNVSRGQQLPDWLTVSFAPSRFQVGARGNVTTGVFMQVGANAPTSGSQATQVVDVQVSSQNNDSTQRECFRAPPVAQNYFNVNCVSLTLNVVRPRTTTVGVNTGLRVTADASTRSIAPGDATFFTLNVTNPSNDNLNFQLETMTGAPVGWRVLFGDCATSCAIGPQATRQVTLSVDAPLEAREPSLVPFVIRARQVGPVPDASNFGQAVVNVTVVGRAATLLEAIDGTRVVDRNSATTFTLRLTNLGTAPDNFTFDPPRFVNSSQRDTWGAQFLRLADRDTQRFVPQSTFLLAPRERTDVYLNVTAPLSAPNGTVAELEVTVRPSSLQTGAQVRLVAVVREYGIELRIANSTAHAVPGDIVSFRVNVTNTGNAPDTILFDVNLGGVANLWNSTRETTSVTLPPGGATDVRFNVLVPRLRILSGAPVVFLAQSQDARAIGRTDVDRSATVQVNLLSYVALSIDPDNKGLDFWQLAVDRNRNPQDGFEVFTDPHPFPYRAIGVYRIDGDDDARVDHLIDLDGDGLPDRYWDPDDNNLAHLAYWPDIDRDGVLEVLLDTTGDRLVDTLYNPTTGRLHRAYQMDIHRDDTPEFLIDRNGDGIFDTYYDPAIGTAGLVTRAERLSGQPNVYAVDTTGGGTPTRHVNVQTGEITDARVAGLGSFFAQYAYFFVLFAAVVALGALVAFRRRR